MTTPFPIPGATTLYYQTPPDFQPPGFHHQVYQSRETLQRAENQHQPRTQPGTVRPQTTNIH